MARTMERTGLSEGLEREILAAVELAADESDLPFLRHKSAWAPHGLAIILMGNLGPTQGCQSVAAREWAFEMCIH